LTVNQVYEILLKWLETKSWEVALREVVPKRKFKTRERNGAVVVGEDNDQDEVEGEIAEDGRGATVPSPPAENPSDVP
jgi:tRNA (guanine9-N1)-methyltransferase